MEKIAVIPARGGSQRIPLKNIKDFLGVPMLVRTIETLQKCESFDRIVVSTDNQHIASLALKSGAEVPFIRSSLLSENYTPTVHVISDAIKRLELNASDAVCCVYATNPFLRVDAVRLGLSMLLNSPEVSYVTTVTSFPFPIQRALAVERDGKLQMANPEFMMTHSQDLEERFHECAQFWWARASTWTAMTGMQTDVSGIYIPRWMVQDIDTLEDWEAAEIKYQILAENGKFNSYVVGPENIVRSRNSLR